MKRKDVHDIDDDFSLGCRSRKSMRLDGGDWLSTMEEEEEEGPSAWLPLQLEHQQRPLPTPTAANNTPSFIDTTITRPSSSHPQEIQRPITLYNPSSTPFFKSPTSPDFSVIINSDFVPGLKDFLFWPQDSWAVKSMKDKATDNGSTGEPNGCLAVVPWVAPLRLLACGTETGIVAPMQPEAEEVEGEMMDTDDNSSSNIGGKAFQDGEMVEEAETFELWQQQQQQHFLVPQCPQNMYTPVTWLQIG